MTDLDISIIGAGPYGLSACAHLRSTGFKVRVFGEPMDFWARRMPEGMLLRSPRVASNLSDPKNHWSLEAYEASTGIAPESPLPLDTFVSYGRWFRQQLGDDVETRHVQSVNRNGEGFRITFQNGETLKSRMVIVAAGIGEFRKVPEVFEDLGPDQRSHCYERRDVRSMAGKRVAVIGAGQSALESAALLSEAGAHVEVIARQPELKWIGMHSWLHHLGPVSSMLYSKHDVGPLGISRLVAYPRIVAKVPLPIRDKIRTRAVRPAGSRWLPARLAKVKITTGRYVKKVSLKGNDVQLELNDGSFRNVDHVLLGTGYRVDLNRYKFLSPELVSQVQQYDGYPRLGRGFTTSVPGLHFIGAPAARSFGPLLYFVAGTEFASKELTSQIPKRNRSIGSRAQIASSRG